MVSARKQPNSRHCFGCGIENPVGLRLKFLQISDEEIRSEFTPPSQYEGFPGVLHGGVIATALDETCARAHIGVDTPRFMYTARLDIRFRKPVPVGTTLSLVGKAGRSRGHSAESWAGLYGPDGELLAEANAVLIDIPETTFPNAELEQLGWKVYPEAWE